MLEEKIKKYVNDQWFYAANKMARDPNLTTDYNLSAWLNSLNKKHNEAKTHYEHQCHRAYLCFLSNWILHKKDLSKAYEALENHLENLKNFQKKDKTESKRPKRSEHNSMIREEVLGAALAISWKFRDQCKSVSDLCKQIDTRTEFLFPDYEEPPLAHSTMEKLLSKWVNKFK